jgi:hypothetical protein
MNDSWDPVAQDSVRGRAEVGAESIVGRHPFLGALSLGQDYLDKGTSWICS